MKDSFIFYESFLSALDELDPETELLVYRAITHYALRNEMPELSGISKAIFHLVQPQIDANTKKYDDYQRDVENGKKGAKYGVLGGRPKKNNPPQKPPLNPPGVISENPINVNVNVNDNENVINTGGVIKKTKKLDPFTENSVIEKFKSEHKRMFGTKLYLDARQRMRIMELYSEIEDFTETIPDVFEKLKTLDFDLPNFNPNSAWLLRENNYTNVLNGLYDGKRKTDIWSELKEKERLRNGTT